MKTIYKIQLFILIAGNIFGAIFGFTWWYGDQLLRSPWYLWLIVAPCPLYAALFVVCISIILLNFRLKNFFIQLLVFITSVGLIKYGIWTVFFWTTYSGSSGLQWYMIAWLVVSHSAMAVESVLLVPKINIKKYGKILVPLSLAWFFLNDFFHYFRNQLTDKIEIPNMDIIFYVAIILTLLSPFIVLLIKKKIKNILS
ncbi:DUF1405 domain-containing protein [Candidatus Woesearchaeota archaeon]|nr:DUF1405 domain-containing protein [Candidatus Woesearchaeota archaeon]